MTGQRKLDFRSLYYPCQQLHCTTNHMVHAVGQASKLPPLSLPATSIALITLPDYHALSRLSQVANMFSCRSHHGQQLLQ